MEIILEHISLQAMRQGTLTERPVFSFRRLSKKRLSRNLSEISREDWGGVGGEVEILN